MEGIKAALRYLSKHWRENDNYCVFCDQEIEENGGMKPCRAIARTKDICDKQSAIVAGLVSVVY